MIWVLFIRRHQSLFLAGFLNGEGILRFWPFYLHCHEPKLHFVFYWVLISGWCYSFLDFPSKYVSGRVFSFVFRPGLISFTAENKSFR